MDHAEAMANVTTLELSSAHSISAKLCCDRSNLSQAVLQSLDLVISVESALGHICSMSDKECWLPYSWLGRDYRIGAGENAGRLWTPKHRIFQQSDDMRWEPVFERIVEALREKVYGG